MRYLSFLLLSGSLLSPFAALAMSHDPPLPTVAAHAAIPVPIYVAVQNDHRIEVLPGDETWPGTEQAHYDAIGPAGKQLLVSGFRSGQVYLLAVPGGEVTATFDIGEVAQGVKISPDGRHGVAIAAKRGVMVVIDLERREVVKEISVGDTPHNARFSDDGSLAYVTLQGEGAIAVVDMQTLAVRRTIATPGLDTPHNLDLSDDGRYLWIRDFVGKVGVLDLEDDTLVTTLEVGNAHGGIDVVPGGKYVATVAIGEAHVILIDAESREIVTRIEVGQGPHGVRASADGRYLYVSVTGENRVSVIDLQTLAVVRHEPVGAFPFWVAVPGNR